MKWWVPLVFIAIIPIFKMELIKYNRSHFECNEKHEANKELIRSKYCRLVNYRIKHKNAGTVDCEKAENELRYSILQCAFISWWSQFELLLLYRRIFGSYWSLLALLCWAMYLTYRFCSAANSENKFYNRMDKIAGVLNNTKNQIKEKGQLTFSYE